MVEPTELSAAGPGLLVKFKVPAGPGLEEGSVAVFGPA
jgi:hypothetical protein